jgi:hypothetical protein
MSDSPIHCLAISPLFQHHVWHEWTKQYKPSIAAFFATPPPLTASDYPITYGFFEKFITTDTEPPPPGQDPKGHCWVACLNRSQYFAPPSAFSTRVINKGLESKFPDPRQPVQFRLVPDLHKPDHCKAVNIIEIESFPPQDTLQHHSPFPPSKNNRPKASGPDLYHTNPLNPLHSSTPPPQPAHSPGHVPVQHPPPATPPEYASPPLTAEPCKDATTYQA